MDGQPGLKSSPQSRLAMAGAVQECCSLGTSEFGRRLKQDCFALLVRIHVLITAKLLFAVASSVTPTTISRVSLLMIRFVGLKEAQVRGGFLLLRLGLIQGNGLLLHGHGFVKLLRLGISGR